MEKIIFFTSAPKKALALLFLSGILFAVNAQTNIHGTVIDNNIKPLEHASVLLLNAKDSSLAKGTLTDEKGTYHFDNTAGGSYLVSATYAGFGQQYTAVFTVSPGKTTLPIETLRLAPEEALATVTVKAKKPLYEQKIDRMVINVAAAITYTGISALDVLERSPGIMVNRANNGISINGKNGVVIMINGKRNYMDLPSVIQMLSGMPSGSIERIEVITTPPANFDAEGNAGIINIVLKSNDQYGTNGSFTLTGGYSKGEQNNASMNINHRNGKVNLFANYSFYRSRMQQLWSIYHAVNNPAGFNESYSEDHRHALQLQHDVQAGMDYDINKKTILGVLLSSNYRHWTMESLNDAAFTTNHTTDTAVHTVNNELHTTSYYGANVNLQHHFKADEKLSINADYLYYRDNNPSSYLNTYNNGAGDFLYLQQEQSSKLTPLKFLIIAADYTKKISGKADMEAGVKATQSWMSNAVNVSSLLQNNWVTDSSLSGDHQQQEYIAAAYSSFNIKLSEKNSVKFGLRYEYTHTNINAAIKKDGVVRSYGNLFPSFFFLHNINEKSSLNFSYSRRIYRPGFYDLAPWVLFLDPKTFQTGNPGLLASITDAVSASYTLKNYIVSVSYSYISPSIIQLPNVNHENNRLVTASQNSKNVQYANINCSLPFSIAKWWNMQNNFSLMWQRSAVVYKTEIFTEQKSFNISSMQNFMLPKDFSIAVSAYYGSKSTWGLYSFEPFKYMDIAFQKKWPQKRSSLSINISNVFNSQKIVYTASIPEQDLLLKGNNVYSYTGISLSFTHNFGNDKLKGKRDRSTGAEDEKGRAY
jgi:hypothetical protein